MRRFHRPSIFSLLLLFSLQITHVSGARNQFQHWYPEFGFIFERIIQENCSSEYDFYLTAQKNRTNWYETSRWIGSGSSAAPIAPLVNFFALCLTVGSPAVVALRAFEYRDPLAVLIDRHGRLAPMFFTFRIELLITVLEYALLFAAITNVGSLGYKLGQSIVLSFAPNFGYVILLWCFFSPVSHMVAAWSLRLRVYWPGRPCIKQYRIPGFSLSSQLGIAWYM